MEIVINLQHLQEFIQLPPDQMLWTFMGNFGWLILGVMYLLATRELWLIHRQIAFLSKVKYVMLAIDIPRGNEQTPKAVENLLAYLAGAHGTINFFEKYWEGKCQTFFSFEIVSIDGYTQFLIRTPVDFRYLVESGIYSQYPDAEITEVDDYTESIPKKYPNEEYDVWGAEFVLTNNHMYPIKLYKEFEHQLGPDEMYFKDPMAALMDLCSSLQKGEQLWYQILVIPTDFEWVKEADVEVDKIVGKKANVSLMNKWIDSLGEGISNASEAVYSLWGDVKPTPEKEFKPLSMMELKPRQKKQIEALHMKSSKLGFLAKIRFVYVAKKEVYNPKKVANGFVGYIKQFMALDLNSFKPDMKYTATSTAFFSKSKRLNERKTNIVVNYIDRSGGSGRTPKILNIEELATIWHFPMEATVKAPMVQKTPGKKAKPPTSLPSEETVVYQETLEPIYSASEARAQTTPSVPPAEKSTTETKSVPQNDSEPVADESAGTPPSNLPFG